MKSLHRVDHTYLRTVALEGCDDSVQIGLGDDRNLQRRPFSKTLRTQPDLTSGLLPRDVQHSAPGSREVRENHRRQRGFADPRRAANQKQRSRDDPATEHAVKLADAALEAWLL